MTANNGNPLLGTWRLRSYIVTTDAGTISMPYGERPSGSLTYSPDMRMHVIGTADVRPVPRGSTTRDDERVVLYNTMFAYAGTYSFDDRAVTHHVDVSWNEAWTGTDQVRFYEIHADTLNILSRAIDPTHKEALFTLVWQRVEGQATSL